MLFPNAMELTLYLSLLMWYLVGVSAGKAKTLRDFALGNDTRTEKSVTYKGYIEADGTGRIRKRTIITTIIDRCSPYLITVTVLATYFGGDITVGVISKVHEIGLTYTFLTLLIPVYWHITSKIFSKHIEVFKDCFSLSDVMYKLYGKGGLWVCNIASLFMGVGMIGIQIIALVKLAQLFLGDTAYIFVISAVLVIIAYSTYGVRAVMATDTVQFLFFSAIIILAVIVGVNELGGVKAMIAKLPQTHKEVRIYDGNFLVFISILIFRFFPVTQGPFVQRYLMAESKKELKKAFRSIGILDLIFTTMVHIMGFIVVCRFPNIDSAQTFSYFLRFCIPEFVQCLLMAAMFAIIISTIDSWLNSTAFLIGHDIYGRLFSYSQEKQAKITKVSTTITGLLSLLIALKMNSIVETVWLICNVWDPIIMIPLCVGFMGFRTAKLTYIVSVVSGAIGVLTGYIVAGELGTISIAFGVVFNTIGFFSTHYFYIKPKRPDLIFFLLQTPSP